MTAVNSAFTPDQVRLWDGLARARASLAARWTDLAFHGYPLGAAGLARAGGNPFDNPVGDRTHTVAGLFSAMVTKPVANSEEEQAVCHAVEELIRVRAVQPLPPGQVVGVFSAMKTLLREESVKIFKQSSGSAEKGGSRTGPASCSPHDAFGIPPEIPSILWELEARVDAVSTVALDCYWICRERLAQMRLEEQERRYSQIIRLANRKSGNKNSGKGEAT